MGGGETEWKERVRHVDSRQRIRGQCLMNEIHVRTEGGREAEKQKAKETCH